MVLTPVGESQVTLKLNGEVVDTYTQSDDSTYDVQASASNQNTETISIQWDWEGSYLSEQTEDSASMSFTVPASLDGYTGSVHTNGDYFGVVSTDNDVSWSGTFTQGDTFTCEYQTSGNDSVAIDYVQVNVNIPIDPAVSADGSTKS